MFNGTKYATKAEAETALKAAMTKQKVYVVNGKEFTDIDAAKSEFATLHDNDIVAKAYNSATIADGTDVSSGFTESTGAHTGYLFAGKAYKTNDGAQTA